MLNPGPKSHEISLKNLTQIFWKSSYYPRRRYEAHRRRDIKKISLRVLFEIFRRSSIKFFLRSSWDLKKIFWRFIRRLTEDFIRRSSEDLLSIFDHLTNFFKTKNKKKPRRYSVDLKKISDEDLPKISKRFELKIFQRSQKDFGNKLLEDLPKKINVDILKIFRRKCFYENLHKIFSSKNLQKVFRRNSAKIFRRMRSCEDLHKRSSWDLILRKISKKIWVMGRWNFFRFNVKNRLVRRPT